MTHGQDGGTSPGRLLSLVVAGADDDPDLIAFLAAHGSDLDPAIEVVTATDRNTALAAATGEWVSFPDPRDPVSADYLRRLTEFLRSDAAGTATVVAGRPVPAPDTARTPSNRHALPHRFREGKRVVDLGERPDWFQLHGDSFAVRRADLAGLRFDPDLTPGFAGAALLARALLGKQHPKVAVLPAARHLYRHRGGEHSAAEPPMATPAQYDTEFGRGHLALLEEAAGRGPIPAWLEMLVAHDLATYLMLDRRADSPTAAFTPQQGDHFLSWARRILERVDTATIGALVETTADVRAAMLGIKGAAGVPDQIRIRRFHHAQRLALVRFYHDDQPIQVGYLVDGAEVAPAFLRRRGVEFFGRTVVRESIAWIPATGTSYAIRINGRASELEPPAPAVTPPPRPRPRPKGGQGIRGRVVRTLRAAVARLRVDPDKALEWWASPRLAGRRYAGAWLLIDRDTEAHDNAEHLYRYLARARADINAWFVLSRDSPDWDRLAGEGFRLLAHGSRAHTIALHNCSHIVSSQVSGFITNPPNWPRQQPVRWQSHFLQHGITKDDISRWINARPIDTLVAATATEYDAFTADGSNYVFSPHEVVLTGFPRNDELLRRAAATTPDERRLVVFMPTWRRDLVTHADASNRVELRPGFWQSSYAVNWFGLVRSARVTAAAAELNLELLFMAHPNMAPLLDASTFGPGIRVATYADTDVQDILAQARVVITDYSSTAFDAAFIDRPVLYFQFDRERFFGGGGYRPGYFDYFRDGFGPVVTELGDAESQLVAMLGAGGEPREPYAARIAETFTLRDGRACERVTRAILDRGRPHGDWADFSPSRNS